MAGSNEILLGPRTFAIYQWRNNENRLIFGDFIKQTWLRYGLFETHCIYFLKPVPHLFLDSYGLPPHEIHDNSSYTICVQSLMLVSRSAWYDQNFKLICPTILNQEGQKQTLRSARQISNTVQHHTMIHGDLGPKCLSFTNTPSIDIFLHLYFTR